MTTLLIAEHDNASVKEGTLKAMSAAKGLGAPIHVLVAGKGASAAAAQAAKMDGAAKVIHVEAAELEHQLAEPMAALIVSMAGAYSAIVSTSATTAKNVSPRVAALLDVQQVSDVMKVHGPDTFDRPTYAGNAIQTVQSADKVKVLTIRTASFPAVALTGSAPIETANAAADPGLSSYVGAELSKSERPELQSAKIVVSGGRALGSAEKFKAVIEPLADKFGAAVGASRAAVDAGYAPNDYQVGQTARWSRPISMSPSAYPARSSIWPA